MKNPKNCSGVGRPGMATGIGFPAFVIEVADKLRGNAHMTVDLKQFSKRIRQIRVEVFGGDGISTLAKELAIPSRTWENYENGVGIPAPIILQFVLLTHVNPVWLLTGNGQTYSNFGSSEHQQTS